MPVMYRKADELEEPDEDGVDWSGPFPCLWQLPRIPPTRAGVPALHGEGTAPGQAVTPRHPVLPVSPAQPAASRATATSTTFNNLLAKL